MVTYEEDKLPESKSWETHSNPYHLVKLINGCVLLAMYIEGKWMTSYFSELTIEVVGWSET